MSSTPFVSSDVDLLWCKDEYDIYLRLFDFSNSPQVYVEASNATNDEVGDDVAILFS
jgi:hypothetical protein